MKYFVVLFALVILAWIGVDIFIPSGSCLVMSAEAAATLSQCCTGFVLVGLVGSFIYPGKEFMGMPIGMLRIIYLVSLAAVVVFFQIGVPITPENLQECSEIIGTY